MRRIAKRMLACVFGIGLLLTGWGAVDYGRNMVVLASEPEEVEQAEFSFDKTTGCLTFFGKGAIVGNLEEASNEAGMKYMDIGEWKKRVDVYKVKTVVIQDGVTEIGEGVFSYMINAKKVTIAGTVKKIGGGAFGGCSKLSEVIFEDGSADSVTEIGVAAFADCVNLKKISLGKNVGILGERFLGTAEALKEIEVSDDNPYLQLKDSMLYSADGTQLYISPRVKKKQIKIADGTKVIRQLAFAGVPVEKITIAASVEVLEAGAFQNCAKLKKVSFAQGSKCLRTEEYYRYFGDEVEEHYIVFGDCSKLKEVVFKSRFENLSENTFLGCGSLQKISFGRNFKGFVKRDGITPTTAMNQTGLKELKQITVAKANEKFCTEKGVLYTRSKNMLCMYPNARKAKNYTVADGVEIIGESAFCGNATLQKIVLGNRVKEIQDYAFCYNTALTSVAMGRVLTKIGERAFMDCRKLSDVTWSKKVKYVGDYAFWDCKSLKTIILNKNAKASICRGAFQGCKNVTRVVWPKSFQRLGAHAFAGCKSITNAVIAGENLKIRTSTFFGCKSLKAVSLSQGVTQIGQYAFYGCASLEKIVIPETVTVIDGMALGYKRSENSFDDVKIKKFTICGKKDSAAQAYAVRNKIRFQLEEH